METGLRQEPAIRQLPTLPARRVDTSSTQRSPANNSSSDEKQARTEAELQRREEQRVIQQLSARDREVRAHEAAHVAVGGQYVVSGPSYTYQQGPNGRNYAIGGEVQLDVSEEAEPQATLDKAETVRRAALAPAEPSPQDRQIAAQAAQMAAQARVAIAVERRNEMQDGTHQGNSSARSGNDQGYAVPQASESLQLNVYV